MLKKLLFAAITVMVPMTFASCDDNTTKANPYIESICDDGIDNDGDGFVDCDDQDCYETATCNPTVEICDDGIDNDGDGFVDCDDVDCFDDCGAEYEFDCGDGIDNDDDGKIDCDDEDCAQNTEECGGGAEWVCDDGEDNDNDGLIDCEDPDCANDCGVDYETHCGDAIDNDNDGLTDCEDPDCATDEEFCGAGMEWTCDDGEDNDNDGLIDCEDPDCTGTPSCENTTCDPVADTGCPLPEAHCYIDAGNTGIGEPYCFSPAGTTATGEVCSVSSDCIPGDICLSTGWGEPTCRIICELANPVCPDGTTCNGWSTYGICM